jgi:competence protein ComGC
MELLIVMAMIAVLAALILPGIGRARQRSYEATCLSNLHQIGQAFTIYEQDYETLPKSLSMLGSASNLSFKKLLICPSDSTERLGYLLQGNRDLPREVAPKIPTSYLYLMHHALDKADWNCLSNVPPSAGIVVCVAHGIRGAVRSVPGALPFPEYEGRILRLRKDGSVKAYELPRDGTHQFLRLYLWEPGMPSKITSPACFE